MNIFSPDEEEPLNIKGKVMALSNNSGTGYKYLVGVHFFHYGEKKGQNDPKNLNRIKILQKQFLRVETASQKTGLSVGEIESLKTIKNEE